MLRPRAMVQMNKYASRAFYLWEEIVMHEHRRPKTKQPRNQSVVEYCRKLGIKAADERKLLALLGKRAPEHELKHNSPPGPPRYR